MSTDENPRGRGRGRGSSFKPRGGRGGGRGRGSSDAKPTLADPVKETTGPIQLKEEKKEEVQAPTPEEKSTEVDSTKQEKKGKYKMYKKKKSPINGANTKSAMQDPCELDGFALVENNALQPIVTILELRTSCEALPTLLRSIYNELASCSRSFGMNISESMFEYYAYICVYYRLLLIDKKEGKLTQEEDATLDHLENLNLFTPIPLAVWLNGLGQLESTDQGRVTFMSFPRMNAQGHFGRVTAVNHVQYETLPAMYVLTERMRREILVFNQDNYDPEWNIDALTPERTEAHDPGLPTRNLLGYGLLQPLTPEQHQIFTHAGIAQQFRVDLDNGYRINSTLILAISRWLGTAAADYKVTREMSHISEGSSGELFYVRTCRNDYEPFVFSRDEHHLDKALKLFASYNGDIRICASAQLAPYRVNRFEGASAVESSWSCYDWGEYQFVPAAWRMTCNAVYNDGSSEVWNHPILETQAYHRQTQLITYVRRSTLDKSLS